MLQLSPGEWIAIAVPATSAATVAVVRGFPVLVKAVLNGTYLKTQEWRVQKEIIESRHTELQKAIERMEDKIDQFSRIEEKVDQIAYAVLTKSKE
jgi:hypothetical protein